MKKNVLYVSYDGMTDPLGQSQVLPYIIGLTNLGYSFTLISFEKPDKYQKTKHIIEQISLENSIEWKPLVYHKSPPILSTLWDIYKMQKLVVELHKEKQFSLIHCRSYIAALIGLMMKRKYSVRFLFDMRGLWANEKVDAGAWDLSKPHYRVIYSFFKRRERDFFLDADQTISLTSAGKKEIYSWDYMSEKEDNISVIPCCSDTNLFDYNSIQKKDIDSWKSKLGIGEIDFVLSYLGSIGTWYMLEEMLDFFVELLKKYPHAKFLFITHDEHDRILREAHRRGIAEKLILQPGQRDQVPILLSLSSLSIFFIRPTYSKIASSPTKQGEIMALGIPVICNDGVGDTAEIVQRYHSGITLSQFNDKEYALAISNFEERKFDRQMIRDGAIDYFGLKKGIQSYADVYSRLVSIDHS